MQIFLIFNYFQEYRKPWYAKLWERLNQTFEPEEALDLHLQIITMPC